MKAIKNINLIAENSDNKTKNEIERINLEREKYITKIKSYEKKIRKFAE